MSFWAEVLDGSSASGLLPFDLKSKGIYGGAPLQRELCFPVDYAVAHLDSIKR